MSSSLPERFSVRSATEHDADAVAEVSRAAETALRGAASIDADDIRAWWREVDLARDTWIVTTDERLVAAATLWHHGDVPSAWGDVHPEFLGRGLGTTLLELTESGARERGAAAIRHDAFVDDRRAAALFAQRGYRDVRHHFEMRIDLADEPPPEPEWPDGIRVTQFRNEDAKEFYDAQMEAFADEWGFSPLPYDEWLRIRLEAPDFDPDVWTIARDGDTVAGVVRCDPFRFGGGWVGAIAVRKPWRRRGLGLALLQHTLRVFHARGERSIGLGVDTENPTGATRLYERAGMHVELESITFEKQLA